MVELIIRNSNGNSTAPGLSLSGSGDYCQVSVRAGRGSREQIIFTGAQYSRKGFEGKGGNDSEQMHDLSDPALRAAEQSELTDTFNSLNRGSIFSLRGRISDITITVSDLIVRDSLFSYYTQNLLEIIVNGNYRIWRESADDPWQLRTEDGKTGEIVEIIPS